ncbi:hypothetical protein [Nocardioides bigeumensis]|uniref:Membrane protein n=1 Tax=Nocardioides bigeumensis TaxID=433657 RepID=A0ABN2Y231_9ACTN
MKLLARVTQLVIACAVLGAGVALLLDARLGSDGYSMFVNGISLTSGVEFWVVNTVLGAVLVAMAWLRGRRPGLGTVAQPIVVGVVVSWLLPRLPEPSSLPLRWVELLAGFAVVCVGVAAYLAVDLGAGPTEVAALAWDPPVPFRWSYSAVQLIGAVAGYLLGASLGPGTVIVVLLIGPVVDRLLPFLRFSDRSRWGRARPARTEAAT